jgi:predicted ribosome quality control (RQC) complex YloA/Tae2 family protein
MSLNWKEMDQVLSELPLVGSHLQNARQPDYRSLVLELYIPRRRYYLYISLETGRTRLHTIASPPAKRNVKPRFVQFLISRLRGARIVAARQIGAERILRLDFLRAEVATVMWIRLWGGAANVIVTTAEGEILDAFFRRPKRGEVSGGTYRVSEEDFASSSKDFEVRDLPGPGTFNERLEAYYGALEERQERESLVAKLQVQFQKEESRLEARLDRLGHRAEAYRNPDRQRQLGDLIMANLHRINRGDSWLHAEAFDGGEELEIPLDPRLEPHQNAERYYQKYKKAHTGLEQTQQEIENTKEQLSELRARRLAVIQDEHADLSQLRSLLDAETQDNQDLDSTVPGLQFRSGPFRILVGRNARENDQLLRRSAKGNDLWMHTRDYPGGFVFVKNIPGKSIPLDTLLDAGNLALYYSKGRRAGKADLYYTQVKHLRRAKQGKKGLVLPTHEKNLTIELDRDRLEKLLSV